LDLDENPVTEEVDVPQGSGLEDWRSVSVPNVHLPAGAHALRLKIVNGGFDIASMTFTLMPSPENSKIRNGEKS
jgi:hypothetical protein